MKLISTHAITDIEKKLEEKCEIFPSKLKYEMTPPLQYTLKQHNVLLHVKYLLAEGLNSRNYMYYLHTKDEVKFPDVESKVFYLWDQDKSLWTQHKRSRFGAIYAKNFIEKIYISVYSLISKFEVSDHTLMKYDQKLLGTTRDLRDVLLTLKDHSIKNYSIKEIINGYVEHLIDQDFVSLLNPPAFLPVANKQVIDLKTGEVRDRIKSDYFTQEIPVAYNPHSHSILWENSISQIMLHDADTIRFLQEIIGYSISGEASQGKVILIIGETNSAR